MADQTQRLEIATVKAEIGSDILSRFSNDPIVAAEIPTESGDIPNLKQVIDVIQQEGAEKISFATTIYPTTAAGIAATANGAIFLVQSPDSDEIYAVWQNVAGVATDTGKRALNGQATQDAMDSAQSSANSAESSAESAAASAGLAQEAVFDVTLRQDLSSTTDVNKGVSLIGGASRTVDSVAALKTLISSHNKSAFVMGYYAAGDGGGGQYRVRVGDTTTADNGGTIIVAGDGARWELQHNGTFRPEQFGARANGTDDWAFITAAISFIRTLGGGVLDLGRGGKSFQVSKPVRLYSNMRITGRAYIAAGVSFTPNVSFPTFGGGAPQTYNTVLYFNDGAFADDPGNFGYSGLEIDAGVVIFGNYRCDNGLIMEGITNYRISGRFQAFNSVGVWAKYYCWGGRINAYISDCLFAPLKLGEAANGIDLNGLQVFGNANNPTYALQIVGDNNGINLAGAFVEKCINGILWTGFSGPSSISGVDFEDCFGDLLTIDGTGLIGRAAGPITVSGSFMEASSIGVKAINAIAIVTGCRMRETAFGFVTQGPLARIYDIANVIESTVVTRSTGNVISDNVLSRRRQVANRLPNDQLSSVEGFAIDNHFYSFNESAKVSNLSFDSVVVDAPSQRMLSTSTWETREMRAGSVFGVCGIKLDYSAGARTVVPRGDNDHSLGTVALRWSVLCAATGTINTSDGRMKTPVSRLSERQIAASIELGKEIGTYKWLDAMTEKGDGARSHIGMTVQRAIEILENHGLDPMECAFICYDKWEAKEAVINDQGEITEPACEAGDRYGFRFDQLLAFIAAGFESRLSALEAK
ncbi:MAG: hypothetical protein M3Q94_11360 [Pseudomonadota bacterium]|nr:hypothetical protein [Pseudomonadota bacterium]